MPQDWAEVLLPRVPIFESIARISLVYLSVFTLLRVVLKREAGAPSISDLLVLVLISDAVQTGMVGRAQSVGDVLILALTLIGWDWLLNYLAYNLPWFDRLIKPRPLLIVKDGRILTANARKELLTRGDIEEQLRLQGVESLDEVREARIESNGEMSVIRQDREQPNKHESRRGV
jgi:uncharacterized membrane protein YcaP (DUF421 family)